MPGETVFEIFVKSTSELSINGAEKAVPNSLLPWVR